MNNIIANARSFLFVPASRPERFAKALASSADCIVIDLEDAVAASQKNLARANINAAFADFTATDKARILIRMNPLDTSEAASDIELFKQLVASGLSAIMVPKAESAQAMHSLQETLGGNIGLVALVESLQGLDNLNALANVENVIRFAFGHLDFQLDLGMQCQPEEQELTPVRFALVAASRRAGLGQPIDGVTVDTQDVAKLEADVTRAKGFGFAAKLCIHPNQVAVVNERFAPSTVEITWSQRVVEQAAVSGGEVFSLDGKMVDLPVILKAESTLARAQQFGLLEE